MKHFKIVELLRNPTDLELGILYFLLGINTAYATDTVISVSYDFLLYLTILVFLVLGVFRLIIFVLVLLSKQIRMSFARWIQLVLIGAAITIILGTNLDLALRVRLSERALHKEVQMLLSAAPDSRERMVNSNLTYRIGLFRAELEDVDVESGTVWFSTMDGEDPFPPPYSLYGGIVYCEREQGPPPKFAEEAYQHLYGPWWRWLQGD